MPMAGGLVAVILWGLAPVATRAAVAHLAPIPLLVLRLTAAALVLLPWAVPTIRRMPPRPLIRLITAGVLGLVGYNLPVTIGLQWLPASTAGLLLATEPVWVMILGYTFPARHGRPADRIGGSAWLGSAAALGGVAILAGPGALTGAGNYRALAGAGLVLVGTLAFAAYTIVLRPLSQAYGAIPATAASTVVGAVPYLAFAGTLSVPRLGHLPGPVWGELAFLGLGSTVVGMLLWNRAILFGGATRVSLLLYLEPVVSVLGAVSFLGERITPVTVAGGLLILAGVAIAARTGRRPPAQRPDVDRVHAPHRRRPSGRVWPPSPWRPNRKKPNKPGARGAGSRLSGDESSRRGVSVTQS
jgi:drug/metabolite transporter (DMT)-like permease